VGDPVSHTIWFQWPVTVALVAAMTVHRLGRLAGRPGVSQSSGAS
jgi:hypothetical protein